MQRLMRGVSEHNVLDLFVQIITLGALYQLQIPDYKEHGIRCQARKYLTNSVYVGQNIFNYDSSFLRIL